MRLEAIVKVSPKNYHARQRQHKGDQCQANTIQHYNSFQMHSAFLSSVLTMKQLPGTAWRTFTDRETDVVIVGQGCDRLIRSEIRRP